MTIRITLLLIVFTRLGLAQTIPEMLLFGLLQGVSQIDFNVYPKEPVFHNGLIVMNSDTIKGQIKLVGGRVYYFNDSIEKAIKIKNKPFYRKVLLIVWPYSKDPKKNSIKAKKITSVRLFAADSLITKDRHMDFIHIDESPILFRRVYSGSLEIFDRAYTTDEGPGYITAGLVVLDKGKRIEDIPHYNDPKKYLVKCINKKFNKDFKTSDFRRLIDVINWLNKNDMTSVDH